MDEPGRFISTVQVGITVFGIALGALGEPLVSRYFDFLPRGVAFAISFSVLTYLSVVLGELVPKAVALQKAERLALALAVPIDLLSKAFAPVVWLLQHSSNAVLRVMRIKPAPVGMIAFTREDIRHSVAAAEDVGEIQTAEEEMLYKVFDFAEKEAADVMVPRPDVVGLSIDLPPDEALRKVLESPYTRYPVYRESLDDIVGILHIRALVEALEDREIDAGELERLLHPAYVVPETKDLAALLGGVPQGEPAHGGRRRRVRRHGRDRDARGHPRGDRRRHRGRVRPSRRVRRAPRRHADPDLGVVHDRRLQRAVRQLDRRRGLPYRGRASCSGTSGAPPRSATSSWTTACKFTVLETSGSRIQRLEVEFLPASVGADDTPEAA